MPFRFEPLDPPDVVLVEAKAYSDERGYFQESYKRSEFLAHGIPESFSQDNHSRSVQGVLRGLHYQAPPRAQGKLVWVSRGEVFDVAVDLRKGSPTYKRWVGVALSAENHRMLYIPVGFAHGFYVLSEEADVVYKTTDEYAPECERGIIWNDPELGIRWPMGRPILSPRDASLPTLKEANSPFIHREKRR